LVVAKAPAGRSVAGGRLKAPTKVAQHDSKPAEIVVSKARVEATMQAARQSGLLGEKGGRIGGRVSPALIKQAKRQTGIQTDTDLIEFALATVALEDHFADAFKESRGKIDPNLKLGF
jgi:DNA-binding transcriptional MocR family regulator